MTELQIPFEFLETLETPPVKGNAVEINTLPSPIWTETKAQLIQNYLRLFLYITKHGVYIDCFAGPQDGKNPESWAAKLVLELSPPWMKKFYLCELNKDSFGELEQMVSEQPQVRGRTIECVNEDCNKWINDLLPRSGITDSTATFALLDQRSTECKWSTVEALAGHKKGETKIELFYFFPTGWIHRALSETKDKQTLTEWWGDESWNVLQQRGQADSALVAVERMQELGYRDVKSWPISERQHGQGRTMYHMIHATDHLEAPKLMYRAYKNLIGNVDPAAQLEFENLGFERPPYSES